MKPIFLIGYMASGKTTFGKALSEKTGKKFIDLDEFIENSMGCSISEIFQKQGEEGFRKIEKEKLIEIADTEDAIIACGGGTPCFFDNMDLINHSGVTVFLKASVPVLVQRLVNENSKRPLVSGKTPEEIATLIKKQLRIRESFYSRAQITWNSDSLDTTEEIKSNIDNFIKNNF